RRGNRPGRRGRTREPETFHTLHPRTSCRAWERRRPTSVFLVVSCNSPAGRRRSQVRGELRPPKMDAPWGHEPRQARAAVAASLSSWDGYTPSLPVQGKAQGESYSIFGLASAAVHAVQSIVVSVANSSPLGLAFELRVHRGRVVLADVLVASRGLTV